VGGGATGLFKRLSVERIPSINLSSTLLGLGPDIILHRFLNEQENRIGQFVEEVGLAPGHHAGVESAAGQHDYRRGHENVHVGIQSSRIG